MACLNSHFQLSKSLEKLSKSGMHFIEKRNDLLYSRASNKHSDTTSDDLRGGTRGNAVRSLTICAQGTLFPVRETKDGGTSYP